MQPMRCGANLRGSVAVCHLTGNQQQRASASAAGVDLAGVERLGCQRDNVRLFFPTRFTHR